jgi:glycerol-3-phosphate acyltransferase PlsY
MDPSAATRTLLVLVGAYALGCIATGYYLVRIRIARDIRLTGSGSCGATNVSRLLGWRGFIVTLVIDAAKGALVVLVARRCQLDAWAVWLAVLAVIAGHIWPAQLRFKGGKGAATYLGAIAMFDWQIGLMLVVLAIAGYLIALNPTLAGLAAITILPVVLWLFNFPREVVFGLVALAGVILFAHRTNIRDGIAQNRLDEQWGRE